MGSFTFFVQRNYQPVHAPYLGDNRGACAVCRKRQARWFRKGTKGFLFRRAARQRLCDEINAFMKMIVAERVVAEAVLEKGAAGEAAAERAALQLRQRTRRLWQRRQLRPRPLQRKPLLRKPLQRLRLQSRPLQKKAPKHQNGTFLTSALWQPLCVGPPP